MSLCLTSGSAVRAKTAFASKPAAESASPMTAGVIHLLLVHPHRPEDRVDVVREPVGAQRSHRPPHDAEGHHREVGIAAVGNAEVLDPVPNIPAEVLELGRHRLERLDRRHVSNQLEQAAPGRIRR